MFEWSDVRIFLAVVEAGSTLGASKRLGVNQTTVSRRVQALEHSLGVPLFDRDTRGYTPTAQGTALLEAAHAMQHGADQLSARAAALTRTGSGRISISAATDAETLWVAPIVAAYQAKHPGVSFEIDDTGRQADLSSGEADIAFRAADALTDDTVIARKLGRVPWALYCSKSYAETAEIPRDLGDLRHHDMVFYAPQMAEGIEFLRSVQHQIDRSRIVYTSTSTTSAANALATKACVGFLPTGTGQLRQDLVQCFTDPCFAQPLWIVASKDAYQTPLVRDFMAFVGGFKLKDGVSLI